MTRQPVGEPMSYSNAYQLVERIAANAGIDAVHPHVLRHTHATALARAGWTAPEIAARLGIRPTKQWGQNFVVDANTVRRIVRTAEVGEADTVVEVGPGLGSLTLAILEKAGHVVAVEVDPVLAAELPATVEAMSPGAGERLDVGHADALRVTDLPGPAPTALVANLPYNVSVPVVLNFLEHFPSLQRVLVMVQLEVAERLAAAPGSKVYGVPSVNAAFYGPVRQSGTIGKNVFWPAPKIESGLVRIDCTRPFDEVLRPRLFALIDASFAQRRKTLRAALSGHFGSGAAAEEALRAADIDPKQRGEKLAVEDFVRLAGI